MKRFTILALTFVLAASMLTACRKDNGSTTTAATKLPAIDPTTRATTAPTTRPSTSPSTTQMPTDPQNTTIGPDGTVGAEGSNNSTDGTGDMAGRSRSGMRNTTRSFRQF